MKNLMFIFAISAILVGCGPKAQDAAVETVDSSACVKACDSTAVVVADSGATVAADTAAVGK